MKEIVSKKTGKIQIISDQIWDQIIEKGLEKRFTMTEIKERKLKDVPVIKPPEILTKTKSKKSNG
jgi:adenine C2-methylase RlmN of 23S rRNA A2503 and tRNA A37